jgi:hypothetical protein
MHLDQESSVTFRAQETLQNRRASACEETPLFLVHPAAGQSTVFIVCRPISPDRAVLSRTKSTRDRASLAKVSENNARLTLVKSSNEPHLKERRVHYPRPMQSESLVAVVRRKASACGFETHCTRSHSSQTRGAMLRGRDIRMVPYTSAFVCLVTEAVCGSGAARSARIHAAASL